MLIDITQDGAGYSSLDNHNFDGFFTDSVESCSIYVFFGNMGCVIIHDIGKLNYIEICEFAKRCGKITSAYYGVNSNLLYKDIKKSHENRRNRIKNLLKIKAIKKVDLPYGEIAVLNDSSIIVEKHKLLELNIDIYKDPSRERRKIINRLNNLFHPTNKQSLPIDAQYNNGVSFTSISSILYSFDYMVDLAKMKKLQGDADFQNELYRAEELGII